MATPTSSARSGLAASTRTLVADHGAHELETVRRLHRAWEATASLRRREGNDAILDAYDRHNRITGGSRAEMIDRAFDARRISLDAGEPLLLTAGDNATADEFPRRCEPNWSPVNGSRWKGRVSPTAQRATAIGS